MATPSYQFGMTLHSLEVGLTVLCRVRETRQLELHVDMPGRLSGVINITEISDVITDQLQSNIREEEIGTWHDEDTDVKYDLRTMFHVGQWVIATVLRSENNNIELSLRPQLISNASILSATKVPSSTKKHTANSSALPVGMPVIGTIKSVEDRGYIIDFGSSISWKGFLPFTNVQLTDASKACHLHHLKDNQTAAESLFSKGDIAVCSIDNADSKTKTIRLTWSVGACKQDASYSTVCVAPNSFAENMKLEYLFAGMVVPAVVESVSDGGIVVKAFNLFTATIDMHHLNNKVEDLAKSYPMGTRLHCRLLAVSHLKKTIFASISSALLWHNLFVPNGMMETVPLTPGDTIDDVKVMYSDQATGLVVKYKKLMCHVRGGMISDDAVKAKKYGVNTVHKARVMGYSSVDMTTMLALKKSALEADVVSVSTLKPSDMVSCTVIAMQPFGAIVALDALEKTKGLVPTAHLADISSGKAAAKFEVGYKSKARVLEVDATKKRVVLTCKPTLIKSQLKALVSYEQAVVGECYHGWISSVKEQHAVVSFYNGVHGLLTRRHYNTEDDLRTLLHVGDVLRVYVVSVAPSQQQLRLSMNPDSAPSALSSNVAGSVNVRLGSHVTAKFAANITAAKALVMEFVHDGVTVRGWLPWQHLTDQQTLAASLADSVVKDKSALDCVVIQCSSNADVPGGRWAQEIRTQFAVDVQVMLTMKPLLISAIDTGALPSENGQLLEGQVLPGYIRSVGPFGALVSFLGNLVSLCLKNALSDSYVTNPESVFAGGETVLAKVLSIDRVKGRALVSVKKSEVSSGYDVKDSWMTGLLRDLDTIAQAEENERIKSADANDKLLTLTDSEWLECATPGSIVSGTVKARKDFGLLLDLEHSIVGVALSAHAPTTAAGGVKAFVLAADKGKHIVDVSLLPELTTPVIAPKKTPKKSKAEASSATPVVGTAYKAVIQLIKENYIVVTIPSLSNAVVYCQGYDYNHFVSPFMIHRIQQWVAVRILRNKQDNVPALGSMPVMTAVPGPNESHIVTINTTTTLSKVTLTEGFVSTCTIQSITTDFIWVNVMGTKARVFILDVSDDINVVRDASTHFTVGQELACVVTKVDAGNRHVDVSLCESAIKHAQLNGVAMTTIRAGTTRIGRVMTVKPSSMVIQLGIHASGVVHMVDIFDVYVENPLKGFTQGMFVNAYILGVDRTSNRIDLSLRECRIKQGSSYIPGDVATVEHAPPAVAINVNGLDIRTARRLTECADIKPVAGSVVRGYVKSSTNLGVWVDIAGQVVARIKISELTDGYVKSEDITKKYPAGMLVRGRIVSVDEVNNKAEMSTRLTKVRGLGKELTFEDMTEGMILPGVVKSVQAYGAFIGLQGSAKVSGLCHKSEMDLEEGSDPLHTYSKGDAVVAKVLKIDMEKKQLSLGLKAIYVSDYHAPEQEVPSDVDEDQRAKSVADDGTKQKIQNIKKKYLETKDEDAEDIGEVVIKKPRKVEQVEQSEDDEQQEEDVEMASEAEQSVEENVEEDEVEGADDDDEQPPVSGSIVPLKASLTNVLWGGEVQTATKKRAIEEDEESDQQEEKEVLTARQKKSRKQKDEEIIAKEEQRALDLDDGKRVPDNSDDFERLIAADPMSSLIWIQYIAFLTSMADIDRARAVCRRALDRMPLEMETERENLWSAWINLEHSFGEKDTTRNVISESVSSADPFRMYKRIFRMYADAKEVQEACDTMKIITKKFGDDQEIWLQYAEYLYPVDMDKARSLLVDALKKVPKKDHVTLRVRFARLEWLNNEAEQARTAFERILADYSTRADVWNVYLDLEIKEGNATRIRQLFERATNIKLSAKKMKYLFKKYLEWEMSRDDSNADHVKEKARAFVRKSMEEKK